MSRTSKYKRGENACGYCQAGHHNKCRPRLDGTLCSCDCPVATELREHHEFKEKQAGKELSPVDTLRFVRPGRVWTKHAAKAQTSTPSTKPQIPAFRRKNPRPVFPVRVVYQRPITDI